MAIGAAFGGAGAALGFGVYRGIGVVGKAITNRLNNVAASKEYWNKKALELRIKYGEKEPELWAMAGGGDGGGGDGVESMVKYINEKPVGFKMTGSQIGKDNSSLGLYSKLINSIEKVSTGIKIDFNLAGRLAIQSSAADIPNGTVFEIRYVRLNGVSALKLNAQGATLWGTPFSIYLRGNNYSVKGATFNPIFK